MAAKPPSTEVPKSLFDFAVKSQISIGRYSTKVVRDILGLLNAADKEVLAKIASKADGTFTKQRLEALLKEIRATYAEVYDTASKEMKQEMVSFARVQAEATTKIISAQLPVTYNIIQATSEQLRAIVDVQPVTVGPDKKLLLEEIFTGLAAGKEESIRGVIRLGMVEGETIDQMVRRLRGTKANQYKDGVLEVSRRHAEAMTRTIVNHTSNQAMQATLKNNAAVVKGWVFTATLDSRTSITCASLSGTVWPVGQGPIPPRHVRCRSIAVPELKSWKELGIDLEEMPPAMRASKDGPVRADISFQDWLKGQDTATQVDILGKTRQKLFADGKLTIDKFTDDAGRVLSLDQLKDKYRLADEAMKVKVEKKTIGSGPLFSKNDPAMNNLFNTAFASSPEPYKQIVGHMADKVSINLQGTWPHYQHGASPAINISKRFKSDEACARHEFGHFVSHCMTAQREPGISTSRVYLSSTDKFHDAFWSDAKALSKLPADAKDTIKTELLSGEYVNEASLSDLFGAVTNKRIEGVFSHKANYFKIPGRRQEEAFANLFDIMAGNNNKALDFARQHLSDLVDAFEQIIADIAKKL